MWLTSNNVDWQYRPGQGAVRVGDVLDEKFVVKGTKNLMVVDASVFPEPTEHNPQLTLMALGVMVAKQVHADLCKITGEKLCLE